MTTTIDIELLGKVIARNMAPTTPLDQTPWDSSECAAYLRVEVTTFQAKYAPLPSFPRPIKASLATGKSYPRWNAQKVIDWFFSHEEEIERRRKPKKTGQQS